MTNIELDNATARVLTEAAQSQNMTINEFVRTRILGTPRSTPLTDQPEIDFDSELDPLLFSGSTLPSDFSRTDVYADHD